MKKNEQGFSRGSFSVAGIIVFFAIYVCAGFPATASSPYNEAADRYPASAGKDSAPSHGGRASKESVFLKWRTIDSSSEERLEVETDYQGQKIFVVKFSEDIGLKEIRSIGDKEISFLEKIPENSYLVKASKNGLARVKAMKTYRRSFLLTAEDKIDPSLLSGGWKEPVVIEALLARGESPAALAAKTRSEFFLALHGDLGNGVRMRWLVKSGNVKKFALELGAFDEVILVSPFFLPIPLNDDSVWVIQSFDTQNQRNYALSATLFGQGILGEGEIAGVADSGLDNDMCYFSYDQSGFTAASYPVPPETGALDPSKKVLGYSVLPGASAYDNNATCGAQINFHGTHTAGSVVGDNYLNLASEADFGHDSGDGMAPMAKIYFQDVGDDTSGCLTGLANDYDDIFGQAFNAGVRVHSNSWGSSAAGVYTTEASSLDAFLYNHEDFSLFFAAGNRGPFTGTIDSPASAKNCVAVGSVVSGSLGADMVSDFSSRGPAQDGRIKPDIMAPGSNIVSASGTVSSEDRNCGFKFMSGTSMATPTAAGGAILLRNYFTKGFYPGGEARQVDAYSPSSSLIKSALIAGAMDVGGSDAPNVMEGWGRVSLDRFTWFKTGDRDPLRCSAYDVRNEAGISNDEEMTFKVTMDRDGLFRAVLVWLDPEGSPMSSVALVNDLDLEAVSPGGDIYYGNNFVLGESIEGGQRDRRNNVEAVYLSSAQQGLWQIRVKAFSVNGTPREDDSDRQGFALVVLRPAGSSPEAAPASLEATDGGLSGISLSWGAVAGASSYSVYRMKGDGSSSGSPVTFIGSSDSAAFTDLKAQGGYLYTYFVRASSGGFEGPASERVSVASTGSCFLRPAFSGVGSAANNDLTPGCDIILGWSAASSRCPLSSGVSYNIYRGAAPDFAPSAETLVASGVETLSYNDTDIPSSVTSYYIVRSEDSSSGGGGPANGGNEDRNFKMINATPFGGPLETGDWLDDGGDTFALMSMEEPWTITSANNHTPFGKYSYSIAEAGLPYPSNACGSLTTPFIELKGDSPKLSYSVSYNLENGWDGVVVELSEDGTDFVPAAPAGGYPGSFVYTGYPPINRCGIAADRGAFSGPNLNGGLTLWTLYTHDLSAYKGKKIKIRWRFSSDPASEYEGFYLDDIKISGVLLPSSCEGSLPGVSFDKASYNCGDAVAVRVFDAKRKGSGEQEVLISSDTETAPERIRAPETPASSGYFIGSIAATSSAPSADGKLSVNDGDVIYASYSGGDGDVVNQASADCSAPSLKSSSLAWFSATTVNMTFTADEMVKAEIKYGKGGALDHVVKDDLISESHSVEINGLDPCSGYDYEITLTDVAGNSTTSSGISFGTKGCFPAPLITAVKKMSDPFRLVVTGSGFMQDSIVRISGYQAPDTAYKSSSKVVAKKGAALKSLVPKGETVQIVVFNTSDMTHSEPFNFTR